MHKKPVFRMSALIIALLTVFFSLAPTMAQGEDGYRETFDDPTLPEWEHSREAIVVDGLLRMNPGSFALRFGDWSDITLTIKVRYSGEGEVFVNYYFRDEGKYGVLLADGIVVLDKEQNRAPTQLGRASVLGVQQNSWIDLKVVVSGEQHQIYVNDELQLTATDPDPLSAGAVLLQALGEATAEFDDLEVRGTGWGPPPAGGEPPHPEGEPGREPPAGAEPRPPEGAPGGEASPPSDGTTGTGTGRAGQDASSIVEEFFSSQASNLELTTFVINLVLAAICSYILSLVYIHWGASLTNRRKFASNFMLMTITTTFIILVVRSSVALSLGLVGALSIVRFRTAVKEAEELAYLFFAIGLGIGLGDNQRLITLLALAAGIVIIGSLKLFRKSQADVNLYLTVASHNPNKVELEEVMRALQAHTSKLRLLRFDEGPEMMETSFLVEFKKVSNLNGARAALRALSDSVEITFLDNKGIW
jgi:hypothetical protein